MNNIYMIHLNDNPINILACKHRVWKIYSNTYEQKYQRKYQQNIFKHQ